MSEHPRRKHTAVMRETLSLEGARVLDVGCGGGALVRFMVRQGARAIGLECGAAQLERARAAEPAGGERYVAGRGEALPFADGGFDVVIFFNSLHHVEVAYQATAIAEAARVLVPGGRLFVMEPLAEGRYFEIMKPVEDETEVRAAAYAALKAAVTEGAWRALQEQVYDAPFKYASFAQWKAESIAISPARRAVIEDREAELETAFTAAAERDGDDFLFWQPSRLNLLERV